MNPLLIRVINSFKDVKELSSFLLIKLFNLLSSCFKTKRYSYNAFGKSFKIHQHDKKSY